MDDCNISDGGLQHLGSALQNHETILQLSIAENPFSPEALSSFLNKLFHSRLQHLRIEPQQCKTEHNNIVQSINEYRYRWQQRFLPPLMFSAFEKELSRGPAFFKALTMRKHC